MLAVFTVLALGLTCPPILHPSPPLFSSKRLNRPNPGVYPGKRADKISQVQFDTCIHENQRKKSVKPPTIIEISDKLIDEKN